MATSIGPRGRDEVLDAVLDAAERLFAAAGPADISLRTIAEEAGVNYGLVHRHFGTKDVLFDRLIERYAQRWLGRLGAEASYREAFDQLLGDDFATGPYLQLLAWTLLSERAADSAEAHRRHATLDRLPTLRPEAVAEEEARVETAAALAFAFGWRFFNPFIRAALHLEDMPAEDLQEAMRDRLHRIGGTPSDRS